MDVYKSLVRLLIEKQLKISTAESITGGKIISSIIQIPGASNITEMSYIVYSNNAKIKALGVSKKTIDKYGIVSKETALEMARRTKQLTKSNVVISTTGEAGPVVNDNNVNIGTVCFGLIINDKEYTYLEKFSGDRLDIIDDSSKFIINKLISKIKWIF